jgi:hypothetical protein
MRHFEFAVEDVFKFADGSTAFIGDSAEEFIAQHGERRCDLLRDGQLIQSVVVNCDRIPNHVTGRVGELQSVVMTRDPVPITRADVVIHSYLLRPTAASPGPGGRDGS